MNGHLNILLVRVGLVLVEEVLTFMMVVQQEFDTTEMHHFITKMSAFEYHFINQIKVAILTGLALTG